MIVAGVGCRRGTSADEIERVVRLALGLLRPAGRAPAGDRHRIGQGDRAGLSEAARRLSVSLVACTAMRSRSRRGPGLTPSKFVLEAKGLPSIAEASAIVVAGRDARLLGARVATARATCAIATGEGR